MIFASSKKPLAFISVCLCISLTTIWLQAQPKSNGQQINFSLHQINLPETKNSPLLMVPRDLAFHPDNNQELWVVNRGAPYQIDEHGSYQPNKDASCEWRYGGRSTPPETSQFWPSFTIIRNPGSKNPRVENRVDPWGIHFLAEASSIAFGTKHFSPHYHGPSEVTDKRGNYISFGTCGESRNEMKGCVDWKNGKWKPSTPLDFQGPTLWSADPAVFAQKNEVADEHLAKSFCSGSGNPEECKRNYMDPICPDNNPACKPGEKGKPFTLGSHLDMLHESPMCMGIAWEQNNAYWVFDGCGGAQFENSRHVVDGHGENFNLQNELNGIAAESDPVRKDCKTNGDIVRFDFRVDHGAGFDDHCDGIIERYAIGQVKRVENVSSHMLMWKGNLFIADSGNGRIARLNPADAGARKNYSQHPLSERVHNACTVVWDMENAEKEILFSYFDLKKASEANNPPPVPSGLAIFPGSALSVVNSKEDLLLVSDNANSQLLFISLTAQAGEPGKLVHTIDLGEQLKPGSIMGLDVQSGTHHIYLTDAVGNNIWRVELQ